MQVRHVLGIALAAVVVASVAGVASWHASRDEGPPPGGGVFVDPEALAVDEAGQLLVADEKAMHLVVLSPDLVVVGRYERMPDRPELFVTRGGGIASIASGHLLLVDVKSQLVEARLEGPGQLKVVRRFGGDLDGTEGIARGPDGRLYVAEEDRRRVVIFSPEGVQLGHWQLVDMPEHVSIAGEVAYVCYAHADWIGRHDLGSGELLGRLAPGAGWDTPDALAVGPDGDLYVSDQGNDRIVVVRPPSPAAPEGTVLRELGGAGRAPGRFDKPEDIVFDRAGRLIVADGGNGRLQVLDLQGGVIAVID